MDNLVIELKAVFVYSFFSCLFCFGCFVLLDGSFRVCFVWLVGWLFFLVCFCLFVCLFVLVFIFSLWIVGE